MRKCVGVRVRSFRALRRRDYFACIGQRTVRDGEPEPFEGRTLRWCLKFWSKQLRLWLGTYNPASRASLPVLPVTVVG